MKVLKSFSIPSLKIFKNSGSPIKSGEIPKEILTRLQKSGHISKPVKKAKK